MNTELAFEYKILACDPENLMKKIFELLKPFVKNSYNMQLTILKYTV